MKHKQSGVEGMVYRLQKYYHVVSPNASSPNQVRLMLSSPNANSPNDKFSLVLIGLR